jgi:hypothetical protein
MTEAEKAIGRAHIQGTIDGVNMAFNVLEESLHIAAKSIRADLIEQLHLRLADLDETTVGAS